MLREWLGYALYVALPLITYALVIKLAISQWRNGDYILGSVLIAVTVLLGLFVLLYAIGSRGGP